MTDNSTHLGTHELRKLAISMAGGADRLAPEHRTLALEDLEHTTGERRRQLLQVLVGSPDPEVRSALARLLVREPDPELRGLVLAGAAIDPGFPIEALATAAGDTVAALRLAAVDVLAARTEALARDAVRARLDDTDECVAARARRACEERGWDATSPPVPTRLLARLREQGARFATVRGRAFRGFVEGTEAGLRSIQDRVRALAEHLQFVIAPSHYGETRLELTAAVYWDRETPKDVPRKRGGPLRQILVDVEDLEYTGDELSGTLTVHHPAIGRALRNGFALLRLRDGADAVLIEPIHLVGADRDPLSVPFRAAMQHPVRGSLPVLLDADVTVEFFPPDWAAPAG